MSAPVRYRVVKRLAHGGMAEIFLALQSGAEGFQKPVVLKRILPALASDPTFVRMLVDEAHIASTLSHSNLVQVLDFRHSGNEYFLVLEFVDGWSLEQVRRRAQKARMKLPLPHVLYIASSLCRALAYVHARKRDGVPLGIVHRDVTPQNVLLSCEGEVKLADFGIAKAAGKSEKSATGIIKGKFAYMSPEQAAGQELDGRSDLFAVGTLLYVLTTGKKPFDGPNDLDVIMQVRRARFEKPSSFVRDFNPDVERLIGRALRANLERRWQTAEQMADKLDAIRSGLGQPSGPAALKRWLEMLSERDGMKPTADASVEDNEASDVVPLTTHDLDLQEISTQGAARTGQPTKQEASPLVPHEVPTLRRPNIHHTPTRVAPSQTAELAELTRSPTPRSRPVEREEPAYGATQRAAVQVPAEERSGRAVSGAPAGSAAPALPVPVPASVPVSVPASLPVSLAASGSVPVPLASRAPEQPHALARVMRGLRRLVVGALLLGICAGTGFYFARPYMPAWMVTPVMGWLHELPWSPFDNGPGR